MSASGHDAVDRPGERVRFCLQCGEVLPFDAARCPACGTLEAVLPVMAGPGDDLLPCPACGAARPASLLFCPRCGAESGAARPAPRSEPAVPAAGRGSGVATLGVVLALLAPLCALLVVLELLLPGGLG
jgi:hypothetical protein